MRSFRFDSSVRLSEDRRTLIGGSPFRLLRLTQRQRQALEAESDETLIERLHRWGFVQPVDRAPPMVDDDALAAVDVVIPTRNRPEAVGRLLASLPVARFASVTVVDDASQPALTLGDGLDAHVQRIRSSTSVGPSAARARGAEVGSASSILFVDDDITVPAPSDAVARLVELVDAWDLGAIAPRIESDPGESMLARYEVDRGAVDRGEEAGVVEPYSRIPFVPTGVLLVRREAYEAVGGFRVDMRRGEDVDLVWRLGVGGWFVRYEPSVVCQHPVDERWSSWLRRRHEYGRSSVELGIQHPEAVAAIDVSPWSMAVWGLLLGGRAFGLVGGVLIWGSSIALLERDLRGLVDDPRSEAIALAGRGTLFAGEALAGAMRRSWWPALVVAAIVAPPARRVLFTSSAGLAVEWRRTRPRLGFTRWCAVALADDLAYGSGLWRGAVARRSLRALRVRWQSIDDLVVTDIGS